LLPPSARLKEGAATFSETSVIFTTISTRHYMYSKDLTVNSSSYENFKFKKESILINKSQHKNNCDTYVPRFGHPCEKLKEIKRPRKKDTG
jgi:hypothetical protein